MKQAVPLLAAAALVATFSAAVHAQTADRAIKYRQGVLYAMNWHMGVLAGMAKGTTPYDKDNAARSAKFVQELSAMPWDGFSPGSDSGAPTKARPEVWKEKPKFDKLARDLQVETAKLASAAGTDLAALRGTIGTTAQACTNCHDDFRAK